MSEKPPGSDDSGRPMVASPFVPVVVNPDTVQFRIGPWAGPAYTVRDEDGEGEIADLVRMLDGRNARDEILDAFDPADRAQVASVLDRLIEEGVVRDASVDVDRIPSFGVISPSLSFTEEDAEALADAAVLVINDGPIGRYVARDLVHAGAEDVSLLEPFGVPGGVADLPTTCRQVASDAEVADVVADADCVAYCSAAPRPNLASRVNEATFESGVSWVSGRLSGFDGFVGPAVLPGRTSCHECFRARFLGNVEDVRAYRRYEEASLEHGGSGGTLPALSRIVAGYVTIDLLHLLLDGIGFTAGAVVHFDFFDLTVESNSVLKLPGCPVCGRSDRESIGRQRHLALDALLEE